MTWSILEEMRTHYQYDVKNLQTSLTDEDISGLRNDGENENSGDGYSGAHRQTILLLLLYRYVVSKVSKHNSCDGCQRTLYSSIRITLTK